MSEDKLPKFQNLFPLPAAKKKKADTAASLCQRGGLPAPLSPGHHSPPPFPLQSPVPKQIKCIHGGARFVPDRPILCYEALDGRIIITEGAEVFCPDCFKHRDITTTARRRVISFEKYLSILRARVREKRRRRIFRFVDEWGEAFRDPTKELE